MLHFFRINDPYRLLAILLFLLAMSMPFMVDPAGMLLMELKNFVVGESIIKGRMMYVELYDNTPPLAAAVFGMMDGLFGRSLVASRGLTLLLILFQASYFSRFLVRTRACGENTYLPALLFGLLCLSSFDMLTLSAEWVGATLLLAALRGSIDTLTSRARRDEITVEVGLFIGLATLAVVSYWVFLPAALFAQLFFTSLTLRRIGLLLFGFLLPHAFLITLYYYWGHLDELWNNFYLGVWTPAEKALVPLKGIALLGAIPTLYFLFSLLSDSRPLQSSKQISQIKRMMLLWLSGAALCLIFSSQLAPAKALPLIPPLAYFINLGLLSIRTRKIGEALLWILLAGVMSVGLMARYGRIETVDYTALFPAANPYEKTIKGKKIFVMGPYESLYRHNELGGFFFNWPLSRPLFSYPLSYADIDCIARSFDVDPPEVIVDEENLMQDAMESIPSLKARYRRQGNLYIRY